MNMVNSSCLKSCTVVKLINIVYKTYATLFKTTCYYKKKMNNVV